MKRVILHIPGLPALEVELSPQNADDLRERFEEAPDRSGILTFQYRTRQYTIRRSAVAVIEVHENREAKA